MLRTSCGRIGLGLLGLTATLGVALRMSPRPGARAIRVVFDYQGAKVRDAMARHEPGLPVATIADQRYRPNDDDATLDVYFPERVRGTDERLPVIVWAHGGAWLAGDKRQVAPYCRLLAVEGYAVVAVNYGLGPGRPYPTAVRQIDDATAYVQANAARFHVDPDRVVLAGDSAGAQLASQTAALVTNPAYAAEVGIVPSLRPEQLRGVLLHCGIYRLKGLTQHDPQLPKIIGWGVDVTVWAYAGTRDVDDPVLRQMSPYFHVTKDFPPTFISGGNGDPLTKLQSRPLAEKLRGLGVDVTELFYPEDHEPSLPHEYQFDLGGEAGQDALRQTLAFLRART